MSVSVVIAYRGSGLINLAIGGYATVAAYAFWGLKRGFFNFTLSTVPAYVLAVAAAIGVGLLAELLVFRPLRTASPLARLVASLGVLLTLQATMLLWFGTAAKQIPSTLPT